LDVFTQLTNEFRGETINRIASVVDETPAKSQTAISSLVPAFLGSLARIRVASERRDGDAEAFADHLVDRLQRR
jgi:hypothetical protein